MLFSHSSHKTETINKTKQNKTKQNKTKFSRYNTFSLLFHSTMLSSMKITTIFFVLSCSMLASVATGKKSNNSNSSGGGGNTSYGNTLDNRVTPVTCDVCGAGDDSTITNPNQSFVMSNGVSWTCGYLQETVQDVNPASLYQNERDMCEKARRLAGLNRCCSRNSVSNAAIVTEIISGECTLCAGRGNGSVASNKRDVVINVANNGVIETTNCGGLENAMWQGIASERLCTTMQQHVGPFCCSSGGVSGRSTPLLRGAASDIP